MDILFLNYDKTDSCSFYRSAGIAPNLRRMSGHNIVTAQWNELNMNWALLVEFDIIMMQRPYNQAALDLCQYIKDMNKILWLDYDDNLFSIPPENKAFKTYNKPDIRKAMKSILELADIITVTTEDLRDSLMPYNSNITVIPNAFNDDLFIKDPWKERSNIVLWRGTDTHIFDLMCFTHPLNELADEYRNDQFMFMGFYPWFLRGSENKGTVDPMDVIVYHKTIRKMRPIIMHVPLHDNLFNRCKSNIAFIEGTFAGSACIVPQWWDYDGALKYTDQKSYYEAFRAVLCGEVNVQAENAKAWHYIRNELTLSKVNVQRMNLINQFK